MSTILQLVGLIALSAGFAWAWPPLGVIVFGFGLLLLGAVMENTPKGH